MLDPLLTAARTLHFALAPQTFLERRLKDYDEQRNDPTRPYATSWLSPYLHFGELVRAALLKLGLPPVLRLADCHPCQQCCGWWL